MNNLINNSHWAWMAYENETPTARSSYLDRLSPYRGPRIIPFERQNPQPTPSNPSNLAEPIMLRIELETNWSLFSETHWCPYPKDTGYPWSFCPFCHKLCQLIYAKASVFIPNATTSTSHKQLLNQTLTYSSWTDATNTHTFTMSQGLRTKDQGPRTCMWWGREYVFVIDS